MLSHTMLFLELVIDRFYLSQPPFWLVPISSDSMWPLLPLELMATGLQSATYLRAATLQTIDTYAISLSHDGLCTSCANFENNI